MNLEDTINKMTSSDYKERVAAEYEQLVLRIAGLKGMLREWEIGTLTFTPASPRYLYLQQLAAMEHYRDVLKARCQIESITLWE